ncbi:signal peptidase I [Archangium gephyra]|uniref:Signal peptidase I n=1 Tax=Archangium gephyra TaxID=48 RepID=A0AAC8TK17_9BACT|nr:signal peptidase I [Archangium gephyra]AKJ07426.1 Signal peptidase I [Archangium gephyra]REG26822.1 signal peptidase I [Archangium gephyra]
MDEAAASSEEKRQAGSRGRAWSGFVLAGVALLLAVLVRGCVAEPRLIISDSMEPALTYGDRLLMEKVSYRLHPPRAGDIVVFEPVPEADRRGALRVEAHIKRVIALPGQVVRVHEGRVLIDGQPLHEPYVAEPPAYEWGPARVPEDMLFVLGDNRNASADSHVWGFLPRRNVLGRVGLRFWPPGRAGGL